MQWFLKSSSPLLNWECVDTCHVWIRLRANRLKKVKCRKESSGVNLFHIECQKKDYLCKALITPLPLFLEWLCLVRKSGGRTSSIREVDVCTRSLDNLLRLTSILCSLEEFRSTPSVIRRVFAPGPLITSVSFFRKTLKQAQISEGQYLLKLQNQYPSW